jgi:uncharacterized protein (DUF2236 family)
LRWGPRERLVAAWLVTSWRAIRPVLPASFRQMPQAIAADRRVAAAESGPISEGSGTSGRTGSP